MEEYKIIFIIANWNRKALLSRCLDSIKTYISVSHKIIIVDNASSDGSQAMVKAKYPHVFLIENSENLGYSRANNQGINFLKEKNIKFDYLIFINNDAFFKDSSMEKLVDYLDNNFNIKAAIPAVRGLGGKLQTGIGGYELSLSNAFNYFFFLSVLFPAYFKGFFISQKYFYRKNLSAKLDWISGVCSVFRSEAMCKTDGFPENFFMYAEDIALCRRIRALGEVIYFPAAQIYHINPGASFQSRPTLWLDSVFKYFRLISGKNRCRGKLLLLKLVFLMGFSMRMVNSFILSGLIKWKRPDNSRELLIYYRHIIKNLFSP